MFFHGPQDPVYTISVAARLLGVAPSFLRQLECEGLISPARTGSNIRLYSDDDLRLLSKIIYLCKDRGVNFQGVRVILAMEEGEAQGPPHEGGPPDPRDQHPLGGFEGRGGRTNSRHTKGKGFAKQE